MKTAIHPEQVTRLAGLELNALRYLGILPGEVFDGTRVPAKGTPIYDVNGEILFYRITLNSNAGQMAYADMAADTRLGAPLLAVSYGQQWDEKAIIKEATNWFQQKIGDKEFDEIRFVAFSFPKIALQFLNDDKEVAMLEWKSWEKVPKTTARDLKARKKLQPGNFERWSMLDETPKKEQQKNSKNFTDRQTVWDQVVDTEEIRRRDTNLVHVDTLDTTITTIPLVDSRVLHYSRDNSDHKTCYELHGQQTNVWCVGASVQMLLEFYRYEYTQVRLARELGLGTLASPNGLPYSRVGDVVTVLEAMTSNALDATMITSPSWSTFRNEIRANRPLISFIPGHSRTIAGYTRSRISLPGRLPFRGLLVYDPWPPNAGVITRWENFDTSTYQFAYTAHVRKV